MSRSSHRALPVWLFALGLSWAGGISCGGSSPIAKVDGGDGGGGMTGRDTGSESSGNIESDGAAADAPADADAAGNALGALGTACTAAGACASGFCFDGLCCNSDCSGLCQSCALAGSEGTCLLAEVGTDPRDDCPDDGIDSCGRDGACDGAGACRRYPPGAICKQPSCSGSTMTLAFRCKASACTPTTGQPCDPFMCGTDGNCAQTCATDQDCTPPNSCNNNSCGKRPLGGACAQASDCNSGICQQQVCCSATCAGTCQSCAVPGNAGACTFVPAGVDLLDQCPDAGMASCGTDGSCDGAGACRFYASGTVCRAPAGACDLAETCAGTGAACPADAFVAAGTACRPAAGMCDVAETCTGTAAACPVDAFLAAGTVCRAAAGMCDVAESCAGTAAACPTDTFVAAGTVCRASTGMCDVAETCAGGTAVCPPDSGSAAAPMPAGLTATPGNAQVTLAWGAVAGASGYNVKRGTTTGGPYVTIASPTTNGYTDAGLTNGTTYDYVVSATSLGGACESANSAQVSATPSACAGIYCDDFELDTVGTVPSGWTRVGGSSGDWSVVTDTTKVLAQTASASSTLRLCYASAAPGAPWSGATSVSAQVKITATGASGQAAMVCLRYTSISNYDCLALGPTGVQIQTKVAGAAANSPLFASTVVTGTSYTVKLGIDAGGVLSAYLGGTLQGTYTPATTLANGFAAVATTSLTASFDNLIVTQP